jgi:hypothetical protein
MLLFLLLILLCYYYYYYYYYYYCNRHTAPVPPQPSVRCAPIYENVGQHCFRIYQILACERSNTARASVLDLWGLACPNGLSIHFVR